MEASIRRQWFQPSGRDASAILRLYATVFLPKNSTGRPDPEMNSLCVLGVHVTAAERFWIGLRH